MKIAIGVDHAAFAHKEVVKQLLIEMGHSVTDFGTNSSESCDYPDIAKEVAQAVSDGKCERGILLCATGIGMAITANRFKNVRAAVCFDEYSTKMSRSHNDANIFCCGSRIFDLETIKKWLKLWLETGFEGGRHERRVKKIEKEAEHDAKERASGWGA